MIYLAIVYFKHVRTPRCFGGTTRLTAHGDVPKVTAAPLLPWVAGAKPAWRWCLSLVYTAGSQGANLKEPPSTRRALHGAMQWPDFGTVLFFLLVFMQLVYSETRVSHPVHTGLSPPAMGWTPAVPVKCHKTSSRNCSPALTWVSNKYRDSGFRAINLCPSQCEGKMFPELQWV